MYRMGIPYCNALAARPERQYEVSALAAATVGNYRVEEAKYFCIDEEACAWRDTLSP